MHGIVEEINNKHSHLVMQTITMIEYNNNNNNDKYGYSIHAKHLSGNRKAKNEANCAHSESDRAFPAF